VLNVMRRVPCEAFVQSGYEEFAYEDSPLPIGEDQTISQPYVVAVMIEAAEVKPGDRVLEVGTGSGYAAAVLSRVVDRVGRRRGQHQTLLKIVRKGKDEYDEHDLGPVLPSVRECRRFTHTRKSNRRDRTGWLGMFWMEPFLKSCCT
jgi:predicted TPR repeat methyltransferase